MFLSSSAEEDEQFPIFGPENKGTCTGWCCARIGGAPGGGGGHASGQQSFKVCWLRVLCHQCIGDQVAVKRKFTTTEVQYFCATSNC